MNGTYLRSKKIAVKKIACEPVCRYARGGCAQKTRHSVCKNNSISTYLNTEKHLFPSK